MTATETKLFRWNPTIGSYVLSQIQIKRDAGERTGVTRFQTRYINTASGWAWECRVTATDAGFSSIQAMIAGVLGSDLIGGLNTAAPVAH